jgi:aquaporin Z
MHAAMTWTSGHRYAAEFLGTFLLLFVVTAAALAALSLGGSGNGIVLVISLAIGLGLTGGIYALGEISGGHFNPAVTLSMAVARRMPRGDVLPYIVAQVVGGVVGVLTIAGVAAGSSGGWSTLVEHSFAAQSYSWNSYPATNPYGVGSVFLFEVALTFLFVLVIQRVTRPENGAKNLAPLAIGLTLLAGNLIGIGIDGASFNPARSFAPAIASQIWPPAGGAFALAESWIFWVAPLIGGILAALVERWVFQPASAASAPAASP